MKMRFRKSACLFFLGFLYAFPSVNGQSIKRLKIGDRIETSEIIKMINFTQPFVKISDFKGKLLLLDFWNTWCGTCITSMPKMYQLQKDFGEKIFVLPITTAKEEGIKKFLQTNRVLSKLDMHSAVEDTTFVNFFPHTMIPHVVWIDGEGIVKAITGSSEVNAENIQAALAGAIALKEKKDVLDYDPTLPLLVGNNGADESFFLQRSVITPMIEGIPSLAGGPFIEEQTIRFRATNSPVIRLYSLAFKELFLLPKSKISFELEDTNTYKKKMWCYDFTTKRDKSIDQVRRFIKNDLDLFFGLNGRMETRMIKCIVLKKNNAVSLSPKEPEQDIQLKALVNRFNNINGHPFVVIDGLGDYNPMLPDTDGRIGIQELKKILNGVGIDCVEEEKEMEVFVLSENES